LARIESKAFLHCISLKLIIIGSHVQSFCSECFSHCK
jgi:hypothetical protein